VGQEFYYTEGDIAFQLLGQRWYDAEMGRFVNRDPIGYEGGINLYASAYVENNSINSVDPEGLGIIAAIKCWNYSKKIVKAGKECEAEFEEILCKYKEKLKDKPQEYLARIYAEIEYMSKYHAAYHDEANWNCIKEKAGEDIYYKWIEACYGAGGFPNKPWDPFPDR